MTSDSQSEDDRFDPDMEYHGDEFGYRLRDSDSLSCRESCLRDLKRGHKITADSTIDADYKALCDSYSLATV